MRYKEAIRTILKKPETSEILDEATREDHNGYLEEYDRIINAVPKILESEASIQILPLIVYGWMPTILKKSVWDDSIAGLLRRKTGKFTNEEMQTLLNFVNDSYIGISKLLHFTDPEHWAIWDSNVYAAVAYVAAEEPKKKLSYYCKDNYSRVDNKRNFDEYQSAIREVSSKTGRTIRDIEKRVFYFGRHLKAIATQDG